MGTALGCLNLLPCRFRSQVDLNFGHITSEDGKEMYEKV